MTSTRTLRGRIAIAATYVVVAMVLDWASSFFVLQTGIAICYPPAGLYLAAILLIGWRALPLAFLSPFFSVLVVLRDPSIPFSSAVAIGASSMISPALILLAVGGRARPERLLGSLRSVVYFVLVTVVAISLETPVAAYAYVATGLAAAEELGVIAVGWWISVVLPYLTLAPLVLLCVAMLRREMPPPPRWAWSVVAILVSGPLFTWAAMVDAGETANVRLYLCLLPILFGVLIGGLAISTVAAFVVTTSALVIAPTALSSAAMVQELQFFLLILAVTALLTGGIEADRKSMQRARIRRRSEGQRLDRGLARLLPALSADLTLAARRLTEVVVDVLGVARASVWRLSARDTQLVGVDTLRESRHVDYPPQDRKRYDRLMVELKRRGTIAVDDVATALNDSKWTRLEPLAAGRGGLLCVPVHSPEALIGVVIYQHDDPHPWTRDEVQFAERTAQHMASAFLTEDLRESEARFQEVAHSIPGVTFQLYVRANGEYGLNYVSPKASEVFGLDPSGEDGLETLAGRLHPDDWDAVIEAFEASRATGANFQAEARVRRAETGQESWCRAMATPSQRPGEVVFNGVVFDVTAQKQAELAQARLATAIEQTAEDVILTDLDAKIQYVNPAFERVTGYTREEVLGKNPRLLQSGAHDESFYRELWNTLGRGEAWNGRIVNRHKDGHLIYHDASISPIFDPAGKPIGYASVKRDVTEQVKLDAQIAQANKMEAIGNLAGGIAHDFNNILTAILGFVELAQTEAGDNPALEDNLRNVVDASLRAKDLVSQILAFSRHSTESPALIRVGEVAAQTLKLMRASLPSTIEIVQDMASDSFVMADRVRIHQILMNLCTNAGQAMRSGGGTVSVSVRDVAVDEERAAELDVPSGSFVEIVVADNGPGMSAEVAERIFEPFFTTKPIGEGTGMGLSVVHGIVHQTGGTISVSTEPGAGAEFRVLLPIAEPGEAVSDETADEAVSGDERVLFVDDEPLIRAVAVRNLERFGYRVDAVASSEEALRVFKDDPALYDVVVTDMTMPGLTGDELASKLFDLRTDLPIIICTGFSDRLDESSAHALGVRTLLAKPIRGRVLAQAIRTTLDEQTRRW